MAKTVLTRRGKDLPAWLKHWEISSKLAVKASGTPFSESVAKKGARRPGSVRPVGQGQVQEGMMGMFTSVDGEVRVVAASFLSLALVPSLVEVREKDLDQVARFRVAITWEAGYAKPVHLLVGGFSEGTFKIAGVSIMDPDGQYGIVPNGTPFVDLEFDMSGTTVGQVPSRSGPTRTRRSPHRT
ncbi:MAG: hypothetical protein MZV49_24160 [Rhodopseudomonas palustris]|nr:hypothetical protein [Rhodopseudomonas palustris]